MINRKGFLQLLGMGGMGTFLPQIKYDYSEKKLLKPPSLKKGDTIGLVSPASRLQKRHEYEEVVTQIKDLGFEVKEGTHARKQFGYYSGRDDQRAEDLNAMFEDPSVNAIMTFRGGWGSNRILDLLDYDLIRRNPKILVGFSDITSLLLAIYARTGLVTFHGPVGTSEWSNFTSSHFQRMLGNNDLSSIQTIDNGVCEDCNEFMVITPGEVKGRLLGGNLTVLTSMLGSEYLPEWKDSILFLEDVGENIYRVDRMLTQLKLNGVLDEIAGFIFGQCTDCDRAFSYSLTLNQVFDDHIKPLGIPAFSGALIGHIDQMITLPMGVPAELDAQEGVIKLEELPVQ